MRIGECWSARKTKCSSFWRCYFHSVFRNGRRSRHGFCLDSPFNVYLNSFSFGFRLFDKKGIDPVYLAYLMRSHAYRKKISMQAQGISRYNLSSSRLSSIKINIPEIREQQKIAEFFMSLDEKIAITEKLLNKSEIISSNILAKVYSGDIRFKQADGSSFPDWEKRQLSQLLRFQNGINASKNKFGSGTKLISVKEVLRDFPVTYDSITSSVEVDEKEAQRFSVEYGDVLFQRSSETAEEAGSANVYLDCRPAVFGGFVIRGKKTTDYQPQFLKMALRSPAVRQQIVRLAKELNISILDKSIYQRLRSNSLVWKSRKKLQS